MTRFSTAIAALLVAFTASAAQLRGKAPEHPARKLGSIPNGPYTETWPFKANCLQPESPGGLFDLSLPSCNSNSSDSDINKEDRIAIVGAGPAGISMAYLLKKRGFDHITIFEKEDRVGGKSKSAEFNGDKFDLGTIYTTNKYECVEHLFDEFNMTEVAIAYNTRPRIVLDPLILGQPHLATSFEWYKNYTNSVYGTQFTDLNEFFAATQYQAELYIGNWTQSMGSLDYFFPDEETVDFSSLNMTFLEWLEERELYTLIPQMHVFTSAQGYGAIKEIPAFYGLQWIHSNFFVGGGSFSVVKEDWQSLWERIVKELELEVITEASISSIRRNDDDSVHIIYQAKGEDTPVSKTMIDVYGDGDDEVTSKVFRAASFDKLIMAMPMPDGLTILDASEEETELFSRYNYKNVKMDLGVISNPGQLAAGVLAPYDVELFSWGSRLDQATDYHVKSFDKNTGTTSRYQWLTDGEDGLLSIIRQGILKQRNTNRDVSLLWSVVSLDDLNTVEDNINMAAAADLAALGIEFEHIVSNRQPDYMPWKNNTDVIEGRVPWRIWDYQGTKNTWFIGSYTSFESVADVLDYNLKLVNERLCEA